MTDGVLARCRQIFDLARLAINENQGEYSENSRLRLIESLAREVILGGDPTEPPAKCPTWARRREFPTRKDLE